MTTATVHWTAADKLAAVERELGFRRRVYPRRVEDGKLSERTADVQISLFEAIRDDYRVLAEGERLL